MTRENERRARELLPTLNTAPLVAGAFEPDVRRLAAALDEAEARGRPQWRPVSERPGDGWCGVLAWAPGEPVQPTVFSPTRGFETIGATGVAPTHWQPLPEPPTPTTEEG